MFKICQRQKLSKSLKVKKYKNNFKERRKSSIFPTSSSKQNFKKIKKECSKQKGENSKGEKIRQANLQKESKMQKEGTTNEIKAKSVTNIESIYLVQCLRKE